MATKQSATVLVQYVIVRGDLWRTENWPIGAIIAQGCHATTAVMHSFMDDPNVREYLADVDHMHKVVLEASTRITCVTRITVPVVLVEPPRENRISMGHVTTSSIVLSAFLPYQSYPDHSC